MCDNGYVKVAVTMPERPADYTGQTEVLIEVEKKFDAAQKLKNEADE